MNISFEGLKVLIGIFCVCFEGLQFNFTAFAMPYTPTKHSESNYLLWTVLKTFRKTTYLVT